MTGSLTGSPSSSSPPLHPMPMPSSSALAIVVIVLAVSALVCVCTFLLVFRRGEARGPTAGEYDQDDPRGAGAAAAEARAANCKAGWMAEEAEGSWRPKPAAAVELVVMAGEEGPTFLAHPVQAEVKGKVVDCPPPRQR